nr:MAG TPA_asm: hypothetical protein [Caudoviricetes sp.]
MCSNLGTVRLYIYRSVHVLLFFTCRCKIMTNIHSFC